MKPDLVSQASAFWRWFAKHQSRFRTVEVPQKETLLDEIQDHLHTYSPDLFFEIGGFPGGVTELIITAEGRRELFPLVWGLVGVAPQLDGWSFIAFKPAQGFDFVTEYGLAKLDPQQCWFLPLESSKNPERIGLRIGCPNFLHPTLQDFEKAALVALDTGLGELRAAEDIGHVEVERLPAEPADNGWIELVELPRYLDRWRSKRAG